MSSPTFQDLETKVCLTSVLSHRYGMELVLHMEGGGQREWFGGDGAGNNVLTVCSAASRKMVP